MRRSNNMGWYSRAASRAGAALAPVSRAVMTHSSLVVRQTKCRAKPVLFIREGQSGEGAIAKSSRHGALRHGSGSHGDYRRNVDRLRRLVHRAQRRSVDHAGLERASVGGYVSRRAALTFR